ncbi:MAG: TIGR00303 family protein [Nitrososphaerales archaeon]
MAFDEVRIAGNEEKARNFVERAMGENCHFVFVISYTKTCEIHGITAAGANPELLQYTPAADAEFIYHGECKCINAVPATPDGKPTPALLTRAALNKAQIPLHVVDAGSKIKPHVPYVTFEVEDGENISNGHALGIESVKKAFDNGVKLGSKLSESIKYIVIGESIPGGTTTALGVLLAMGIDARFKVSSSMPDNPHKLKLSIIENGMKSAGISFGSLANKPLEAVSYMGDPMMPSVAGIAIGASKRCSVMLAGGTQMAAALSIINAIDDKSLERVVIGTTRYILDDRSSDICNLIGSIADVPILAADPYLHKSRKEGLRAYANGFVKEGAGAGGACIAAMLKSQGSINANALLQEIENEYEHSIERSF